jgi:hypothetical protein
MRCQWSTGRRNGALCSLKSAVLIATPGWAAIEFCEKHAGRWLANVARSRANGITLNIPEGYVVQAVA